MKQRVGPGTLVEVAEVLREGNRGERLAPPEKLAITSVSYSEVAAELAPDVPRIYPPTAPLAMCLAGGEPGERRTGREGGIARKVYEILTVEPLGLRRGLREA